MPSSFAGNTAPNSQAGYNTGSTLSYNSGVNKTSTAISTNIIIYVGNTAVGAVQSLNIQENRSVRMIDEIGTDGHIDSVPIKSTDIKGSCERVRFDNLRISQAFSRGFLHVSSQVYPFDIVILDRHKSQDTARITTIIKNVWITSLDVKYNAENWVISDNMSWEAETILSISGTSPGGTNSAAFGGGSAMGERGIVPAIFTAPGVPGQSGNIGIEQLSDTGAQGRRGSLDAGGLVDMLGADPQSKTYY